ncbi:hypothetical protein DTO271G3_5855 [Paecilomyces variotii]|nr:hypothetical protein DTO271G3_5855 [Paecilomyces variotii]
MPPFVPRKRSLSVDDPPNAKRPAQSGAHTVHASIEISDSEDSDSSLSDAPPSENELSKEPSGDSDYESSDDAVDWEDAMDTAGPSASNTTPATPAVETGDLELTLDKDEIHITDLLEGKKGPTKIERFIRMQTHCMHVQCLLFHNAIRNAWISDAKVHDILRGKLPEAIKKEVKKWRIFSGLEMPEEKPPEKNKKKGRKSKNKEASRDWGEDSSRVEPGQPDMSRGDPLISLLRILAAYWKKQFKVTAPGLRKRGYMPLSVLEAEIKSFQNDDHDPLKHGERIRNREEFRSVADRMQGSRDVGAQLFTSLLRALGIEARLVSSLQPLGFGWTKAETYTPPNKAQPDAEEEEEERKTEESDSETSDETTSTSKGYDHDLPFPTYWTEAVSPVTHEVIPVDPLVLSNAVATTPELVASFEPRGAKAERAKQVIAYVVAYSTDGTAKDVTTRYLRRRTWPGKTKGYRLPVEKIPKPGRKGQYFEYDWFRVTMRGYTRPENKRTVVDDVEDAKDLLPHQPDKKPVKEGDTLQSLRASTEFVLERFMRREEAIRPGAKHVRTFTSGKGNKAKEEKVFRRQDVVKCQSSESWHKEGRQIKMGEKPLKLVPIRAVTLMRKREVDEFERETGEKPKQGLYAQYQTEYIIPPPIQNGVIPKNAYGNIDCFVPSMVPQGASHIPWRGTVRICKKLGIDYAEAVTGFEFGSKMAVPIIEGVVVAAENEGLVKDAWRADEAERRKKEQLKQEKRILQTWRKFLMGLRIAERVREEYGQDPNATEADSHNPFTNRRQQTERVPEEHEPTPDPVDHGGGFLLPGQDDSDDGGLIVEHHHPGPSRSLGDGGTSKDEGEDKEDGMDLSSSDVDSLSSDDDNDDDNEPEYTEVRRASVRRRRVRR